MTIAVLISICFAVAGIMLKMKLPSLVRPFVCHPMTHLCMRSVTGSCVHPTIHCVSDSGSDWPQGACQFSLLAELCMTKQCIMAAYYCAAMHGPLMVSTSSCQTVAVDPLTAIPPTMYCCGASLLPPVVGICAHIINLVWVDAHRHGISVHCRAFQQCPVLRL